MFCVPVFIFFISSVYIVGCGIAKPENPLDSDASVGFRTSKLGIKMLAEGADTTWWINDKFHFGNSHKITDFERNNDETGKTDPIPQYTGDHDLLILTAITIPDTNLLNFPLSDSTKWRDEVTWDWQFWKQTSQQANGAESTWIKASTRVTPSNDREDREVNQYFIAEFDSCGVWRIGVTASDTNDDLITLPEVYNVGKEGAKAFGILLNSPCR